MSSLHTIFDGESLITPDLIAGAAGPAAIPRAEAAGAAELHLALLLGSTQERLRTGVNIPAAMDGLVRGLHRLRSELDPAVWLRLVPMVQSHPVAALIHEDPFTAWSFAKPRGYSGDAGLLDFIYGHDSKRDLLEAASPLGRAVYDYTSRAPAPSAVRERRDILARLVDEVAEAQGGGAEILSVAAGHLREGDRSQALRSGRVARWVALDQDAWSVGTVARDFAGTPVEAVNGSVRGLLRGTYRLGRFDLVYAAGLYDYLPKAAAIRLTCTCLGMLKPKGLFLFANFARGIVDDGSMETFMNWSLLLRSEGEMWDIVNASNADGAYETRVFPGANRNILYATLRRPE